MKFYWLSVLLGFILFSCNQAKVDNSPIDYFKLNDVRLLDSEFKNATETGHQLPDGIRHRPFACSLSARSRVKAQG